MDERYRTLIVDDDPEWQEIYQTMLGDKCRITPCESIESVLTLLNRDRVFDLALVDLTIDRAGDEWQITTPEDLILYLQSLGIGVAVFTAVSN